MKTKQFNKLRGSFLTGKPTYKEFEQKIEELEGCGIDTVNPFGQAYPC